ncbi:MAG: LytTR family DNA-binding domain-containing protein [Saprospiraceae bacterium]|nr:LytTR family DNA-binding domain-containing protein [Saprospiraceae bacterium]
MNIAIIDDEPIAIGILERYTAQIEGLKLVGTGNNALEAYNLLQKTPVDLLFLDIEMPVMNGFSLLKSLENPPPVILTTAYREYALEGYEMNVLDYLLKPVSFERFLKAIEKARAQLALRTSQPPERAFQYFKSDKKMVQVFLDEVLYVESMSNYVRIFLVGGASVVTYLRMADLEKTLPASAFIRIHRSFLVRRDRIRAYTPQTVEVGGRELPVGGQYRTGFYETMGVKGC